MGKSVCITNTQWELYAKGKLPLAELTMLQTHVQTCEVCADIKDGLDLMENKALLNQHIERIHQEVETKVKTQPKTIALRTWFSVAAAAILLVAVGVAVYNQKNTLTTSPPIAKIEVPRLNSDSTQVTKQQELENNKQLATAVKPKLKSELTNSNTQQLTQPEQIPLAASDAAVAEDLAPVVVEDKTKEQPLPEVAAVKQLSDAETEEIQTVTTKAKRNIQSKSTQPSARYPSNYNAASNTMLNTLELVDTGWVDLVKSYYNKQQWDSCVLVSQSYLSHPNSTTKEYAYYYTALAQLKLGNTFLAKQYLKQCINLDGALRNEAQTQLDKLP